MVDLHHAHRLRGDSAAGAFALALIARPFAAAAAESVGHLRHGDHGLAVDHDGLTVHRLHAGAGFEMRHGGIDQLFRCHTGPLCESVALRIFIHLARGG